MPKEAARPTCDACGNELKWKPNPRPPKRGEGSWGHWGCPACEQAALEAAKPGEAEAEGQ